MISPGHLQAIDTSRHTRMATGHLPTSATAPAHIPTCPQGGKGWQPGTYPHQLQLLLTSGHVTQDRGHRTRAKPSGSVSETLWLLPAAPFVGSPTPRRLRHFERQRRSRWGEHLGWQGDGIHEIKSTTRSPATWHPAAMPNEMSREKFHQGALSVDPHKTPGGGGFIPSSRRLKEKGP